MKEKMWVKCASKKNIENNEVVKKQWQSIKHNPHPIVYIYIQYKRNAATMKHNCTKLNAGKSVNNRRNFFFFFRFVFFFFMGIKIKTEASVTICIHTHVWHRNCSVSFMIHSFDIFDWMFLFFFFILCNHKNIDASFEFLEPEYRKYTLVSSIKKYCSFLCFEIKKT